MGRPGLAPALRHNITHKLRQAHHIKQLNKRQHKPSSQQIQCERAALLFAQLGYLLIVDRLYIDHRRSKKNSQSQTNNNWCVVLMKVFTCQEVVSSLDTFNLRMRSHFHAFKYLILLLNKKTVFSFQKEY